MAAGTGRAEHKELGIWCPGCLLKIPAVGLGCGPEIVGSKNAITYIVNFDDRFIQGEGFPNDEIQAISFWSGDVTPSQFH